MSFISNTALAFSMSADAFAASLGKGVALQKPKLSYALRVGAIFGGVEMITPIIGWCIGRAASGFIEAVDHWIAFGILLIIGAKMIYEAIAAPREEKKKTHASGVLILTALGTSIDAMAVGATLAWMDVSILLMAAMIGFATFMMATIGIMTGHYLGLKAGRIAELLGGLCLIAIGTKILTQHLGLL